MTKSLLFVATNPIRNPDGIVQTANALLADGWAVTLWSYSTVPNDLVALNIRICGPQIAVKKQGSNQIVARVIRAVWRKIKNRFRRDLIWWSIKRDKNLEKHAFAVVAAVDSPAIFSTWKFMKHNSNVNGRANMTNLVAFCRSINL